MGPKRPEHQAPPEVFYNETEARKYTENSRIIEIQTTMSERAIELLALPDEPCLLLDLGCGSGLSGSVLEDNGHVWVGLDISPSMLDVAKDRVTQGDLVLNDLGQGVPFRAGTFDGAISISALQWLCNRDRHYEFPVKRLYKFFSTLYAALNRTARVALQFYPENTAQIEIITSQAMRAGFFGGVVIDYPNSTKAKKFFLVLRTGGAFAIPTPMGVGEDDKDEVNFTNKSAINIRKNVAGRPVRLKSVIQPLLHPTRRTVTREKSKDMTDLLKFIPAIKHGYYKTLKDKSTGWELKYGERRWHCL